MSHVKLAILMPNKIKSIELFGSLVGRGPDSHCFVGRAGRYALLHFDLVVSGGNDTPDRQRMRKDIKEIVVGHDGGPLTDTVFVVPLLDGEQYVQEAIDFWNEIKAKTNGRLVLGDAFYLHFPHDEDCLIGGIAQVVPNGRDSLDWVYRP